mgnify:CR=1 FL=1
MSQVNFIQNFRYFMEYGKRNKLTSYERIFYLSLFYLANEMAMQDEKHEWPDDYFPVSNSEIKVLTDFGDRAIRETRNSLKQKGLIDFKKGDRKISDPEYRISYMKRVGYKVIPSLISEQGIDCENAPNSVPNSREKGVIGCENAPNTVPNSVPNSVPNTVPNTVPNDVVIGCENAPNKPVSSSIYKNININTKINTKVNTKSNPILSGERMGTEENPPPTEQVYEELIKQNIDYGSLIVSRPEDKPLVDEIVDLILETVLSGRERIQVAGDLRPAGIVKQRLLKLNNSHIDYVLHCFHQNTADIQNMKQYLLAMLFNAPVTMEAYWQAKVQYNMG